MSAIKTWVVRRFTEDGGSWRVNNAWSVDRLNDAEAWLTKPCHISGRKMQIRRRRAKQMLTNRPPLTRKQMLKRWKRNRRWEDSLNNDWDATRQAWGLSNDD